LGNYTKILGGGDSPQHDFFSVFSKKKNILVNLRLHCFINPTFKPVFQSRGFPEHEIPGFSLILQPETKGFGRTENSIVRFEKPSKVATFKNTSNFLTKYVLVSNTGRKYTFNGLIFKIK